MQDHAITRIATGAIVSSVAILACIYYISNFLSHSEQKQRQQPASKCSETVHVVYKDVKAVFKDKLVALGAPSEILSYAIVAYIGAHSIGSTGENPKSGLHSAKGGFIYEIPNPRIRLQLFKSGLIDTTVLPKDLFHSELAKSEAQNFVSLTAASNAYGTSIEDTTGKDGKSHKSFSVGTTNIKKYMAEYFDNQTSRQAVCS